MPESRDNTEEDQVTTSGNGASPNGSADDAADVATRVDAESATEPGDPTVAGRNGDVDSADADPDLSPREQAKQAARERAGERKRQREERRAARRESGSALTERIARFRTGEGWRRPRADGQPRPKIKKLRFLLVLIGLGLLAIVSWVFGVMMAVAQDLPDLEARAQYDAAQNSVVLASDGTPLATLTGNEKRILVE